jgi:hypothetical protein
VPKFDHHRLDAFSVARDALTGGDAIARRSPRDYAALADQLRRALLSCFLGIGESLLDRLCAMLTRLAGPSHRPADTRD